MDIKVKPDLIIINLSSHSIQFNLIQPKHHHRSRVPNECYIICALLLLPLFSNVPSVQLLGVNSCKFYNTSTMITLLSRKIDSTFSFNLTTLRGHCIANSLRSILLVVAWEKSNCCKFGTIIIIER